MIEPPMAVLVVSYSRVDQPIVRPIVKLLQGAFPNIDRAVFWDDDLKAGTPWFKQIKGAIDEAPQLFVFWCAHSGGSKQVTREYRYALHKKKLVVPVLLDDTPLATDLALIHGIDLRQAVFHKVLAAAGASVPPTDFGSLASEEMRRLFKEIEERQGKERRPTRIPPAKPRPRDPGERIRVHDLLRRLGEAQRGRLLESSDHMVISAFRQFLAPRALNP